MTSHPTRALAAALAAAAWAVACSSSTRETASAGSIDATPTYYGQVKSLLDAKCVQCHQSGGIAPFALTDPAAVASMHESIADAVASGSMPPWPPSSSCTTYKHDRSLAAEDVERIKRWSAAGAPIGDPSEAPPPKTSQVASLSRVDRTLALPEPYTPTKGPDDYRCFIVDWPDAETTYITGFGVKPDKPEIVHHVLAFAVPPQGLAALQKLDDADPGPGYTCFGGPGNGDLVGTRMLGAWAPGSLGEDTPPGTGIRVDPGSKVVVQVHYNTHDGPPVADQSSIALKLDSNVEKEARTMFFTNPKWVRDRSMLIPAGAADVPFSFDYDAVEFVSSSSRGAFPKGEPVTVHAAALHMHTRGAKATLKVTRPDGGDACLLDIPRWDFHWQGQYTMTDSVTVRPGDRLSLECHFDNTPEHQPYEDGKKVTPRDLNWGEGTHDEMCLAWVYVTK